MQIEKMPATKYEKKKRFYINQGTKEQCQYDLLLFYAWHLVDVRVWALTVYAVDMLCSEFDCIFGCIA